MHEAIGNQVTTSRHDGTITAAGLPGEVFTRRIITVVLSLITALTFAFGFGNVWTLGRELGVPAFVAPLVGPSVDLSVAGLLVGIRHLSMTGVSRDQLRAARILLTACGAATLALNIAGPVAAGAYGRAGFDSVGPLLLIGWAETGPGLLRHLYATQSRQLPAGAEPSAAASSLPVWPARLRVPDWLACGQILVQDTRWAGVGNWAMFRPTSAMIAWAPSPRRAPGPVLPSASMPWAAGIAAISSSIRVVSLPIWADRASIWSSSIRASSAWCSSNLPVSAWTSRSCLAFIRPRASPASTTGSRSPAISASSMSRTDSVSSLLATAET